MASSKLLKEAIADAKAVRETALANAKIQLEEAFTPRLKSMLSQKLRAEAADAEDETGEEEDEKMEEDYNSSNIGAGNGGTTSGQNNKKPTEHNAGAEDKLAAADVTSTSKKPEAEVEDFEFEKSITEESGEEEDLASGDVKFATEADEFGGDDEQQHAEPDADNAGGESDMDADNQQSEDDLDLEAIIKELEDELHGGSDDMESEDDYNAMGHDDVQDEAADEVDVDMHAADPNRVMAQHESDDKDEDDDMNIEEIIKELEEEEKAEEEEKEKVEESKRLKSELAEAISVIKSLKSTINEVNLLNAKLLFSNKLFRSYNLTNEQKSKVIDSLDRTNTVREVKLVYSTLAESMKFATNSPKKSAKPMAEGASRVQTSTKPSTQKEIVSEGTTYANRFKELAGILK
jgi:hypothetical protein